MTTQLPKKQTGSAKKRRHARSVLFLQKKIIAAVKDQPEIIEIQKATNSLAIYK